MPIVLFILFPLMILTGLAMSPGGNALLPFLPDLLGGRQTARTIHFVVMVLLVGFFVDPHPDDPRGRADQRIAVDHHRLVPHRSAGRRCRQRTEGMTMQKFQINRRSFITAAAVGGSGLALSGCDVFDGLAAGRRPAQCLRERQ